MAGEKVLVVDDAPQNVKLLRLILKDAGYQVVEATNGQEALQSAERERPDAVILDVRMPGMTGYEVCTQLRQRAALHTVPVIMVTALSMPEDRIRGIEAGATDFITKPFNKRELLARLSSSLAMARAERTVGTVPLNEPVILADTQWRVLEATPLAAGYLGLTASAARGFDLRGLLQQQALAPPDGESNWSFHLQTAGEFGDVAARATQVQTPDGRPILWVIALREETRRFT